MNREYANDVKESISTQSVYYRLMACLIILFVAYGCSRTSPSIIRAAGSGDIATIKSLRSAGGNINEQDKAGCTPLMYAIWAHKTDTARFLIESGADLKIKDYYGYDALIYAVDYGDYGNYEIIKLLLDKGADIESRDNKGWTPLMHTVDVSGSEKTARLLIKRGADLNAKDAKSNTPLELAIYYKHTGLIAEFKRAIANYGKDIPTAKMVFIRDDSNVLLMPAEMHDVAVYIYERIVNMSRKSTDSIDIDPGKCTIMIKGSNFGRDNMKSFNAIAGQTYYFSVSRGGSSAANLVVGIGISATTGIGGAGSSTNEADLFEITQLEESLAKEKLKHF